MLTIGDILMIQNIAHEVEREYGRINISEVSRRSGFNKRTVMKYLNPENIQSAQVARKVPSKLDGFKPYIQSRIAEYPKLSASRIFEEIKGKGYDGGYTILVVYIRELRGKTPKLAVMRYETKPGEQAQVDWGTLGDIEIDGEMQTVYVFSMVLGYSRTIYAELTTSQNEMTFLNCHQHAFQYFGGVPERILYDNTKTVILKKSFDFKKNQWNPTFMDFSQHYGFRPSTCRPYRPQTKGKVERTVGYIKDNFYYGRKFKSFEDLKQEFSMWLEKANKRVHGTTNKVPFERLEKERTKLRDISKIPPYTIVIMENRRVSSDSYISFRDNKYSVPYKYSRRVVTLKISATSFDVYCDDEFVCKHSIAHGTNRTITIKEHSKGLYKEILEQRVKEKIPVSSEIIKFKEMEVEERPLSFYESVSDNEVKEGDDY